MIVCVNFITLPQSGRVIHSLWQFYKLDYVDLIHSHTERRQFYPDDRSYYIFAYDMYSKYVR